DSVARRVVSIASLNDYLQGHRAVQGRTISDIIRRPLSSTLFPYTTLFRSCANGRPRSGNDPWISSRGDPGRRRRTMVPTARDPRSEEHTSELQSLRHLVCRLLLEKKNRTNCFPRCHGFPRARWSWPSELSP